MSPTPFSKGDLEGLMRRDIPLFFCRVTEAIKVGQRRLRPIASDLLLAAVDCRPLTTDHSPSSSLLLSSCNG